MTTDGIWALEPSARRRLEQFRDCFKNGEHPRDRHEINFSFTLLPGDANRDCKVDGSDVTIVGNNWQYGVGDPDPDATWDMGDFNGDGMVDGSDVTILANNWQTFYWQQASPPMMAMSSMSSLSTGSLAASRSSRSVATIDTVFADYGFTTETEDDDTVYGTDK